MATDKQEVKADAIEARVAAARMPKSDWQEALGRLGKGAQLYLAKQDHQYAGVARFATETHVVQEFTKRSGNGQEMKVGIIHDLSSLTNRKTVLRDLEEGRLLGKRVTVNYEGSVGELSKTKMPFVERYRDAAKELIAEIKSPKQRANLTTFAEKMLEKLTIESTRRLVPPAKEVSVEIDKKDKPLPR